jgi:hypothetical protein
LRVSGETTSLLVDINAITDQIENYHALESCLLKMSFFKAVTSLSDSYSSSFSLKLSFSSFLKFLASISLSSLFMAALLSALPF